MQEEASIQVWVRHPPGINVRVAMHIAKCALDYACDVLIEYAGCQANAKSVLSLLALNAVEGVKLQISASGPQSTSAIAAVCRQLSLDEPELNPV